MLTSIIIPALTKTPRCTLVFCHGLGDSGAGWAFLADNYRMKSQFEDVRFVFLNSPVRPITVNRGMRMPGWYDILSFGSLSSAQDSDGMKQSAKDIQEVIAQEVESGVPSERIVIGGFSQGGVMALLAGLTSTIKLGGIVALSCYLPLRDSIEELRTPINKDTPIFLAHGEEDPIVRFEWGQLTRQYLEKTNQPLEFHSYPGLEHSASPLELDHLQAFLEKVWAPKQ